MFVQMSEQLNQAEQDMISYCQLSYMIAAERDRMAVAIKVVFKTLHGQLESLEKEVYGHTGNNSEDWELESRKQLARFAQKRAENYTQG